VSTLKPGDPAIAVDIEGTTVRDVALVDREMIFTIAGGRGVVRNLAGVPVEVDEFGTLSYEITLRDGADRASASRLVHWALALWSERQEPLRLLAAPGGNSALIDRYGLSIELPECADALMSVFTEPDS
jgi:hypothetical protein